MDQCLRHEVKLAFNAAVEKTYLFKFQPFLMSVLVKGLFSEDARHYSRQHSGVGVATPSRDKSLTPPTSI
jgi:hypothetical protein